MTNKHQLNYEIGYSHEEQMEGVLSKLFKTTELRDRIFRAVYMEVVSRIDFAYRIEAIIEKEDGECVSTS